MHTHCKMEMIPHERKAENFNYIKFAEFFDQSGGTSLPISERG